ncbi:orotate phosphoribosyltransferase [Limnochorda pilosa]|uniref:Orotate phosphoribosyltransferase n=1 Tax=Limnochorda pilosa TaxID=1555112 RepID=A0A0K2SGJ8_LIMPI|nr:orotate phosphoribosyltransferase [Limnochorda pilosa]BAS25974.1 orotate phosphoribosyltransferase [Limnochorda pilosa]
MSLNGEPAGVAPGWAETWMRERGALLEGHFLLSSGLHSDRYLEKFRLLEDPARAEEALRLLLEPWLRGAEPVAACLGPLTGGAFMAWAAARLLGTRFLFAEREAGRLSLRRGFRLEPDEPVLVTEDVLTTGGSARETLELVHQAGARPLALVVLADRRAPDVQDLGVPVRALWSLPLGAWPPRTCPLCLAGTPLTERGSRRLAGP